MKRSQRKPAVTGKRASQFNYSLKCIIIGDSGVGKTCIVRKLEGMKNPLQSTPTMDGIYNRRLMIVDNVVIELSIWDTAGSEAFKSITQIYYRGASCAILVYDITNRRTFLSLNSWLEDLDERCDNSKVIKMLVANKSDCGQDRAVSREEGQSFAEAHNMVYIETSAASGTNVREAFELTARQLYHNIKIGNLVPNCEHNGIKLGTRTGLVGELVAGQTDAKQRGCNC